MKIAPLIAIVSMVAAAPSFASTMFASSLGLGDGGATDRLITDSTGALVGSGYAGTGTFSITNAEVTSFIAANNFQGLISAFTAVASDNFVTGASSPDVFGTAVPGAYIESSNSFDPTSIIGKTFYTLIYSTNATTNQVEYAVLAFNNTAITADPTSPPVPNSYNLTAADATVLFGKTGGTATSTTIGGGSAVSTISLQPVPEASTALLGLLGVAGLVRRRR